MIHRFIGTSTKLVQQMASQPVTLASVTKTVRGILTTAQHTLTVFGLSAVAVLALLYNRPDLAKRVSDFLSPQQTVQIAAAPRHKPARPARKPSRSPSSDDKQAAHPRASRST
jgi:hypothetical protein